LLVRVVGLVGLCVHVYVVGMLVIYLLTFINVDECALQLLVAAHPMSLILSPNFLLVQHSYNMDFRGCLSLEG